MNILLVTTWDTACGIAEHSAMLIDALRTVDRSVTITPSALGLNPDEVIRTDERYDILHLNYHAALHSRWTPTIVRQFQSAGKKVVITYHDTGVPNSDHCKALEAVADAFVVHEPCEDLPRAHYIRMGVGNWPQSTLPTGDHRPWLGTVGFPFPWKCYDQLAKTTASQGWGLMLLAPTATAEQVDQWAVLNPYLFVISDFVSRSRVVQSLAECDATAFTYVCHNTGQSGAILQGIAARKPVIALKTCRQFRALYEDPLGRATIKWAETFEDVAAHLRNIRLQRCDPGIVALAEQESWTKVGAKYVEIYRRLL